MKEKLTLETSLHQQQRLTPLQVQFVNMLEMTAPEIEEAVNRALDEMPALEAHDNERDTAQSVISPTASPTDDLPAYRYRVYNRGADDQYYDVIAAAPERAETLIEALGRQLSLLHLDDIEKNIAVNIIGNLDDNGYITRDLRSIADDVSAATGSEVTEAQVNKVWQDVRSLDPPGIGAVDLRDCLLLQLRRLPESESIKRATEMIAHYFDLFSKLHYDRLRAAMGISESQLKEAIAVIRHLNPKPGAAFAGASVEDEARHVIPDFAIEIDGDRLVLISLAHIPELTIERTFSADTPITAPVAPRQRGEDPNLFIRRKREEAQDFIKALTMRRDTLYRVMQAILKIQHEYFLSGDENTIKPMILKDIKDLTGYSLSMISRATAGKYVTTPFGTFPLKKLFNEKPKEDNDTSSHQIMGAIRQLIEQEDSRHPLSDEAITQSLTSQGYDIARRTVAKYRERLGFPVARLRRKL